MKRIYTLIFIATAFMYGHINAQAPDWMWAKSFGTTNNDNGQAIAVDEDGNIFAGGTFEGTVDFDPGPGVHNLTSGGILDGYILKLDSTGNFLWAYAIGGTHTDNVYSMAADDMGNIYITGRFGNTVDFDTGPGVAHLKTFGYRGMFVFKF